MVVRDKPTSALAGRNAAGTWVIGIIVGGLYSRAEQSRAATPTTSYRVTHKKWPSSLRYNSSPQSHQSRVLSPPQPSYFLSSISTSNGKAKQDTQYHTSHSSLDQVCSIHGLFLPPSSLRRVFTKFVDMLLSAKIPTKCGISARFYPRHGPPLSTLFRTAMEYC